MKWLLVKIGLAILVAGGSAVALIYFHVSTHSPRALAGARWASAATAAALGDVKENAQKWRVAHGSHPKTFAQINQKGWRKQFRNSGTGWVDVHSGERVWMAKGAGGVAIVLEGIDAYSCKELASNFLYHGLDFEKQGRGPWYSAFVVNGKRLRISGKQEHPNTEVPLGTDLDAVLTVCGTEPTGGRLTVMWEGL